MCNKSLENISHCMYLVTAVTNSKEVNDEVRGKIRFWERLLSLS